MTVEIPDSDITRQPFSHGPGFPVCKDCAAGITEGVIEHAPSCAWVAQLRAEGGAIAAALAATVVVEAEAWQHAMAAGFQAQRDFRAEHGNPEWDSDWDDEAEAIIHAAWPHIARYEHRAGRVGERQRIREARIRVSADDDGTFSINGRRYYYVPADLLGGTDD